MKRRFVACFKFDRQAVRLVTVDTTTGETKRRETLFPGFEVLNPAGKVAHPAKLAAFIKATADSPGFPAWVKVAIGLRQLELKQLVLPEMPEAELAQVVKDEAQRESIFSYTGEPVAVAYKVLSQSGNGISGNARTIMAAVTPHETVQNIIEVFEQTGLKLVSIQPSLAGLDYVVANMLPASERPRAILLVGGDDTELYVWEKSAPLFWRYLSVGSEEPKRLGNEIQASLEHFYNRFPQSPPVEEVVLIGASVGLDLGRNLKVNALPVDQSADLWGLALAKQDQAELRFDLPFSGWRRQSMGRLWITLVLGVLLFFNAWMGRQMLNGLRREAQLRQTVIRQRQMLADKQKQLGKLEKALPRVGDNAHAFDGELFLGQLRAAVPADLRFAGINLDLDAGTLQVTGVCLKSESLDRFVSRLHEVDGIRGADLVELNREDRSGLTVNVFRLNLLLEVSSHEQP